jgi:hypothetical protein
VSHRLGSVLTPPGGPLVMGPGSGQAATSPNVWQTTFSPPPAPGGTKFLMLHFTSPSFAGADRLEVDLGYATDVFTAASGADFWTRPVSGNSITVRYLDDGSGTGQVTLSQYGRGEGLQGGGQVNTNADVFLLGSPFAEPTFWNTACICPQGTNPSWENVGCLPPGVMRTAARSVGMFVNVHGDHLSSCSAALIAPDLILTAGHCISTDAEAVTGAFTLDFQTNCDGTRPTGYNPRFFKLLRVVRTGFARAPGDPRPRLDYSVIQLDPGPAGVGAPALQMRTGAPAPMEELFSIHHPRGVVKKVSRRPADPGCSASSPNPAVLSFACDLDNGSSGSPTFDMAARIVAVNVTCSGGCINNGASTPAIVQDFTTAPPPVRDVDVMLVFDRSGSMSLPGVGSGLTKIQEARQAAALFVDLLRTTATHRAGLVSFSTASARDFPLSAVSDPNKTMLIGPPPARNAGIVGGIAPGGWTTIGGGLQLAQQDFPAPGPTTNAPAILLMTDGLENTPPMIADVESQLAGTKVCVIGFGTEASLDGPRLSRLALAHDGLYTRAGEGLSLKKFFVLCFGTIFESGISTDPYYTLAAGATAAPPIPLDVCGENSLTVVLGWHGPGAELQLSLVTPAGVTIAAGTIGATASAGDTWAYLRLQLPFNGERDGTWEVRVTRTAIGPGELADVEPLPEERFFITSVINGGPFLRPLPVGRPYYTGDAINPAVELIDPAGARVAADVSLEIEAPTEGTGNLLARSGLREGRDVDGDALDPRTTTLVGLEAEQGGSLISTSLQTLQLFDDGEHGDGALEPDGIFANTQPDVTRFEGNYSFRARASFGTACRASREASWSVYVAVGIDPGQTEVTTQRVGLLPDGRQQVQITLTPRDRYGNYLGPGRADAFDVQGQPGSEPIGAARDDGRGSYTQDVAWDSGAGLPPGVVVGQPGRPPVVFPPPERARALAYLFWLLMLLVILLALAVVLLLVYD